MEVPQYDVPVDHLGPVWELNPEWDGVSFTGPRAKYVLPEFSLGYQFWAWVRGYPDENGRRTPNLLSPDSTDDNPIAFTPTYEQWRFVIWWYAVDSSGRFLFRRGVLQRLKGHGKDPLAAVLSAVEMLGPCRFRGWANKDLPKYGREPDGRCTVRRGMPVAMENPNAWVQIAAVTKFQTQNTMNLFPGLISDTAKRNAHMREDNIGITKVSAFKGRRQIQAVTSNPRALEGGRPTLVIKNESLALDTPIPTPNGWTTMGELKDGDVAYGSDGQPTTVIKALPVQHDRRCFRVTFATGDSIVASDGHWWKVRVARNRNCKLREMTTLQMFEAGRQFFLPELQPLETGDDVDLPIDPYILGLWLGDGHSQDSQIATDPQDTDEILAEVSRLGVRKPARTGLKGQIMLSDSGRSDRPVGYKGQSIKSKLRQMDLLRNKHLPGTYLRASKRQRLALLQGLMDSDGSIRRDGHARFCNTDLRLLEGVRDLLLGLGYECNAPAFQTRDAQRWPDRAHWKPLGTISFVAYEELNPFRLSRKAKLVRSGPMPESRLRAIVKIEEVESVPVRCIAVSAEDRLFRAGNGLHTTRNTEHWLETNNGWEMDAAIDRNAAKSKGGAARALAICNAPQPSEDSVGLRERQAYLDEMEGRAFKTGVLYDSLEIPAHIGFFPPEVKPEELGPEHEPLVRAWLRECIKKARGDSYWLDPERLIDEILDQKTPPSVSRRFYLNQTVAAEDVRFKPDAVDAAVDVMTAMMRNPTCDQIRIGWEQVRPDEPIVMFFDGSKSEDATGLVGCRLSDGYTFTIGIWQPPPKKRGGGFYQVPRSEVDARVEEAFERFEIVGFFADPSHAQDDSEEEGGYWTGMIDEWHRRYKNDLQHWAVKTGDRQHAISWDMSSPLHTRMIVEATEFVADELHAIDEFGEPAPQFSIDGHPRLKEHLKNAKKSPGPYGVGVRKESRNSTRKIDLAVCLIGARMLRRLILNAEVEEETRGGWATSV